MFSCTLQLIIGEQNQLKLHKIYSKYFFRTFLSPISEGGKKCISELALGNTYILSLAKVVGMSKSLDRGQIINIIWCFPTGARIIQVTVTTNNCFPSF